MRRSSCGYSRKGGLATLAGSALILALSVGSGSALAQDEPTPEPVGPETEEIDLLFSHNANSGVFRDRGERPGKILVLHGVSRTTWFESHPGRQSGHLPTRGFVRSWEGFGFRKDPPNAALTVRGRHGTVTSVLELRNPHYRARTDTVRYRAEVLGADEAQDSFDENQARPPRRFKDASLFVDDAAAPVVNGCVLQPYTNCVGADLWGEGLLRANLSNANLSNANLGNADLSGADLSYANLTHADLSYAYLSYANLFYADLTGALAVGTYMTDTMFCRTTMPDGEIQTNWNGDGCR